MTEIRYAISYLITQQKNTVDFEYIRKAACKK